MLMTPTEAIIMGVYFTTLYFSIFWLLVLFEKEEKSPKKELKKFPKFSVLVPAWNEEKTVIETIKSAAALDYPKDKLEIIVINDGSTDKTREIVEHYIANAPKFPKITLINQENKGKGYALNRALEDVSGEFFACLDADSFISPDALRVMLPFFENQNVAAVCPMMKIRKPETLLQRIQWYEYLVNFFYKHLNAKLDSIHVTPGPFSVYRTKTIIGLGGYDENNITEDLEIAIRLQKHNYKLIQTLDTTVYTVGPTTIKALFAQRNRWYKGSVINTVKYRKLMFNKKYGDFGIIRMPTIALSGILAIIVLGLMIKSVTSAIYTWSTRLWAINFNIPLLIQRLDFSFNLLKINFTAVFIFLFVITMGVFVLVYSHKFMGEKIYNHSKAFISLGTYMLLYSFLITLVWVAILFEMVFGKTQKW